MISLLVLLVLVQEPEVKIAPAKDPGFAKIVATSKIYEIRTDASPEVAREVARMLENLHQAFVTEFKVPSDKIQRPLLVSFYATGQGFAKEQPMAAMGLGGFYDPPSKRLHCVMQQPNGDDWRLVLRHEGTHQLLNQRLSIGGGQPGQGSAVWFNEGFASYWATAKWDGRKVLTGDPHPMLLKEYRKLEQSKQLMSLKELIEAQMGPSMPMIYAQGWALCHFLRHGKYKDKFGAYLESEQAGKIRWDDFRKALGIDKPDDFEKDFRRHVAGLR